MEMIEQIIQDIEQHGFSHIESALDSVQLQHLAVLFAGEFSPARVGHHQERQRVESIRGDYIHWIDPLNPPEELNETIRFLNELKQKLNQKFYLGLKDFECHLAKYPPGSFYKKHLDRFNNDSSRVFTFVFYLNEEWSEQDGGELLIYNKDGQVIRTIVPRPGTLVCFMAEEFPHEVKTSHRERRSFTGWMHTKILT